MLDPLEPRALFSVLLENGILRITGTDAADVLTITTETAVTNSIPGSMFTGVRVNLNGEEHSFSQSAIRRIRINTLGGDDIVTANFPGLTGTSEIPVPGFRQFIHGGDGDDTLRGGDARDLIRGGQGDDQIFGSTRPLGMTGDRLVGGPGDDAIHGGHGPDTILGSTGHDTLSAFDGDDRVFGGDGDDQIDGSDGADRLLGGRGDDTLTAGELGGIILVDAPARTPDDDRDTLLGGPGNDLADIIRDDRLKQIETVRRD